VTTQFDTGDGLVSWWGRFLSAVDTFHIEDVDFTLKSL